VRDGGPTYGCTVPKTYADLNAGLLKIHLPLWVSGLQLRHGYFWQLESKTQTASRPVQPFLQAHDGDGQTDRLTDHATRSVTIGRICVGSTAMRPNNLTAAATT